MVRIALHPAELGQMTIIVQRVDDGLQIRMLAETETGFQALSGERERLEHALRDAREGEPNSGDPPGSRSDRERLPHADSSEQSRFLSAMGQPTGFDEPGSQSTGETARGWRI